MKQAAHEIKAHECKAQRSGMSRGSVVGHKEGHNEYTNNQSVHGPNIQTHLQELVNPINPLQIAGRVL